ncbi:hypothetical protein ABK040_009045 [Willaertia magna]
MKNIIFALLAILFVSTCLVTSRRLSKYELSDEEMDSLFDTLFADVLADTASSLSAGSTLRVTQGLNVRSGACTNYGLVTSLSQGETVQYTGSSQSGCGYTWYQIKGSFGTGWAASNWLQEVSGPSPTPSNGDLSVAQLQKIMPRISSSKANQYIGYLNAAMKEAGINTCCRKSAFLAQLAHESGDLNWFEEFADGSAYEGRKDLGNTQPGDGKRYKGRGPIQLTGRANYRAAGQALGLDLEGNPTLAAQPSVGFRTAAWFWNSRSLNNYADCTQSGFDQITRRINGGYNGKPDRDAHWVSAKGLLGC